MKLQLYGWPKLDGPGFATTSEERMEAFRFMRDVLLRESDWIMLSDCPLDQGIIDQWRLWRQYMRDLPALIDEPIEYVITINDPPEEGRPPSWDNWDLERGAQPYGVGTISD